jgi:hypothetical protein
MRSQANWKPLSDSTGKLAIHTSPYDTIVIVNGETGTNQGPGNGYGSLARFNKPGCAYGAATVRVVNERGAAYMFNGQSEIKIADGCSRWKRVGNSLQRNVKQSRVTDSPTTLTHADLVRSHR